MPPVVLLFVSLHVHEPVLLNLLVLLPYDLVESKLFLLSLALFVQVDQVQLVELLVHYFEHLHLVQRVLGKARLAHDLSHLVVERQLVKVDLRCSVDTVLLLACAEFLILSSLELVQDFDFESSVDVLFEVFKDLIMVNLLVGFATFIRDRNGVARAVLDEVLHHLFESYFSL